MMQEWKLPMRYGGRECGDAALRRDGLYWQIECDCAPVTDRIVRAYLQGEGGAVGLGVLVPEEGRLRLRRRMAASGLPAGDFSAVELTEREDGWTPWEGTILGQPVRDAYVRQAGAARQAAVPFSSQEPFGPMALFHRGAPIRLEGRQYLAIPLEE